MTWSGELLQLAAESVTRHWERSRQLVGAAGERYLLALFPHRPLENCCTHEVNSYNLFLVIHFSLTPSQKSSPFGSLSPLSTAVVLLQKDLPMSAPDHSPFGSSFFPWRGAGGGAGRPLVHRVHHHCQGLGAQLSVQGGRGCFQPLRRGGGGARSWEKCAA